jgi:hypothetical protein
MSLFGIDCGPVRPPFQNLPAGDRERLRTELEQIGIRELAHTDRSSLTPTDV